MVRLSQSPFDLIWYIFLNLGIGIALQNPQKLFRVSEIIVDVSAAGLTRTFDCSYFILTTYIHDGIFTYLKYYTPRVVNITFKTTKYRIMTITGTTIYTIYNNRWKKTG